MNIIELLIKVTGSNNAKGSLTDLKSGLDMVSGALGKLKEAGVAAFEFAEAGAKVAQTKRSFDDLGISIGTLREAANGTVSDMTLMSSTLALVTGTSGELKSGLLSAADDLMKIAKAASDLNPTLGDTGFMYQSLALGIKRGQKDIIDNTGIIVDATLANKKFADSVGKNVDELSDEERKLALLNETVSIGNGLIEQAGGDVEALTDNYGKFRANIENATNGLKEQAGAAGGVVDVLGDLIGNYSEWYDAANATGKSVFGLNGALQSAQLFLTGTNSTIEEYKNQLEEQDLAQKRVEATAAAYAKAYGEQVTPQMNQAADATAQYYNALQTQADATARAEAQQLALAEAARANEEASAATATASLNFAASLGEMGKQAFVNLQLETLNGLYKEGEIDLHTYRAAQLEVMKQSGMLTQSEMNAAAQMDTLNGKLASGAIRASEYASSVLNLYDNINKLQDKTVRITIKQEGQIPSIGAGPESKNTVGAFAEGGPVAQSQLAIVGERGPELVRLPAGSYVHTAAESERMMGGAMQVHAPVTVYAQIAGDQDVYRLADQISEIIGRRVQSYA